MGKANFIQNERKRIDWGRVKEEEGKKIPWRYRWPEEVNDEVHARLMDLNQKRHEEESNQAQSTKKKPAPKRAKKDDNQSELF